MRNKSFTFIIIIITVTKVGEVSQLKNLKTVGNPLKPLQSVKATFIDTTGPIPLDVFQEHIPKISAGKSYKYSQMCGLAPKRFPQQSQPP